MRPEGARLGAEKISSSRLTSLNAVAMVKRSIDPISSGERSALDVNKEATS
jgi:hypothetical protein